MSKSLFRIAASAASSILQVGRHIVTIMAITADQAMAKHKLWNDPTPQAKVLFKNSEGIFTEWMNLKGYTRFDELSKKDQASGKFLAVSDPDFPSDRPYAVVKRTGERIVSDDRTHTSEGIVAQMIHACGYEKGTEVDSEDLIGKELGIVVKDNGNGKLRARTFYRANAKTAKAVLQES